eukprot:7972546-Heterocapsa_arctica.AAC.1
MLGLRAPPADEVVDSCWNPAHRGQREPRATQPGARRRPSTLWRRASRPRRKYAMKSERERLCFASGTAPIRGCGTAPTPRQRRGSMSTTLRQDNVCLYSGQEGMQPNVAATESRSESTGLTQHKGAGLMRLGHAVHLGSRPNISIDLSGKLLGNKCISTARTRTDSCGRILLGALVAGFISRMMAE